MKAPPLFLLTLLDVFSRYAADSTGGSFRLFFDDMVTP